MAFFLFLNGPRKRIEQKQKKKAFTVGVSVCLKPISQGLRFHVQELKLLDLSSGNSRRKKVKSVL